MAILHVGPGSAFPSIAAAMAAATAGDTIQLESGYGNEIATVRFNNMVISGDATSTGIELRLATGIATFTLGGDAPINIRDALDGNGLVGNDGDNVIRVSGGADAVAGGLGTDRLIVDYRQATGAVTGDSTSNFAEAGIGGRLVSITDGTFEHFTVLTGSGVDTITTGAGDDIITTGAGASTVNAGQGFNRITGGDDADTITALDGGNLVDGGNGSNTITTGGGRDTIYSGTGADTIVAGAESDRIILRGGADTVDAGADVDRLIIDYSAFNTAVVGGISAGDLSAGYTGVVADLAGNSVEFENAENFNITSGSGDDSLTTGDGTDELSGRAGDDTLIGGGGDDDLRGGAGRDEMHGGLGNDRYWVETAGDLAIEDTAGTAGGIDTVISQRTHTLGANLEILRLQGSQDLDGTGNGLANTISGTAGANLLRGLGGDDTLGGRDGADTLAGGRGNDTMTGGAQADVFQFTNSRAGADTITDFNEDADRFDLSGGSFGSLTTGLNGDTILQHDGGTVRMNGSYQLTLAQWNALVLPAAGLSSEATELWSGGRAIAPETFSMQSALPFSPSEFTGAGHGDFLFA
jgi:Ca2+-binding RTX toxin-like protein